MFLPRVFLLLLAFSLSSAAPGRLEVLDQNYYNNHQRLQQQAYHQNAANAYQKQPEVAAASYEAPAKPSHEIHGISHSKLLETILALYKGKSHGIHGLEQYAGDKILDSILSQYQSRADDGKVLLSMDVLSKSKFLESIISKMDKSQIDKLAPLVQKFLQKLTADKRSKRQVPDLSSFSSLLSSNPADLLSEKSTAAMIKLVQGAAKPGLSEKQVCKAVDLVDEFQEKVGTPMLTKAVKQLGESENKAAQMEQFTASLEPMQQIAGKVAKLAVSSRFGCTQELSTKFATTLWNVQKSANLDKNNPVDIALTKSIKTLEESAKGAKNRKAEKSTLTQWMDLLKGRTAWF